MKLQQLTLENFMLHRSLSVQWGGTSPIVLVCGPNEHGKSALVDAIDFALRGDCSRMDSKGERKSLITEGAKKGAVTLSIGDASLQRNVADGKVSALAGDFAMAAGKAELWPFVVNHQAFSALSADDRRRTLFSALDVGTSVSDITVLLAERGHANSRIGLIADHIGRSMDAAVKFAKAKVSEARGAWQEVTGETYGSLKAEGWTPETREVPTDAAEQLEALVGRRDVLAKKREDLVLERRTLADQERLATERETRAIEARKRITDLGCPVGVEYTSWLLELEEHVRHASEARGKALAELEANQAALDALQAEAAQPKTYGCPCCSTVLVFSGDQLVELEKDNLPASEKDAAERERLSALVEKASLAAEAENGKIRRYRQMLEQARPMVQTVLEHLAALDDSVGGEDSGRSIDQVTADIQAIDQEGSAITLKRNELQSLLSAAENNAKRAARAAELNADLTAWTAMAEALEPSGIPAELLAKALRPLNERLRASATATGWDQVQVAEDMAIYYGNRPYRLASESGRWRADAMITEAVLFLAGVRSLVLDRMDVLDLPSRSACLRWLHGLAQRGELQSALVLGTLKEPPKLPATYNVIWLGEPANKPGA